MNLNSLTSVELDGVSMADYPDFVDAYICYAEDSNGNALSDEQLEEISDDEDYQEFVQEMAHESIF